MEAHSSTISWQIYLPAEIYLPAGIYLPAVAVLPGAMRTKPGGE